MRFPPVLAGCPALFAVFSITPLGVAQTHPTAKEIQAALDKSRPALHKHLKQSRGDVLALVCLAAVHDGLDRSDKRFLAAANRLRVSVLRGTYGAALRLMVLADDPDAFGPLTFEQRLKLVKTDVKAILRNRIGGGFTYRKRASYLDLSNTQYAALGLRAAVSLGADIPVKIWRGMLLATLKLQADDGGFGYTKSRRRRKPYASMTVAGIAVLQICKQNLPASLCAEHEVDEALAGGWLWMKNHRERIGRDNTLSCLYFHYGLERAAVLSDVEKIDGKDWYRLGARMLLEMQNAKDGSWRSFWEIRPGGLGGPGSPVDTAFGVLFLRRKFQKVLPIRYPRMLTLTAQATEPEIEAATRRAVRDGDRSVPSILKALRSAVPPRRRAAAAALRAIAGEDFGIDPKLDPSRSGDAIKSAEKWWLERNSGR